MALQMAEPCKTETETLSLRRLRQGSGSAEGRPPDPNRSHPAVSREVSLGEPCSWARQGSLSTAKAQVGRRLVFKVTLVRAPLNYAGGLRIWCGGIIWQFSFTAQRDPFSHSRVVSRALFGAKRCDVKSVSLIQRDA